LYTPLTTSLEAFSGDKGLTVVLLRRKLKKDSDKKTRATAIKKKAIEALTSFEPKLRSYIKSIPHITIPTSKVMIGGGILFFIMAIYFLKVGVFSEEGVNFIKKSWDYALD